MTGRCAVETFAEFDFWATPKTSGITLDSGTAAHAFICSGCEEVFVFDLKEKKLTLLQLQSVLQAVQGLLFSSIMLSHLHRFSSTQSSSPTELKVASEDIVIREEGVLCLITVGTVLVTLSRRDPSWIFAVNKPGEQSGLYETLSSFCLPIISEGGEERKPVMNYVGLGDSLLSENKLEPTLFKLLFGIDSALIKSPIVLCGFPDGRLCSLSLRLPGIRVFHSLEEPVVFVGASVVMETDAGGPYARCLVAVGENGRVLTIKTCKGATEEGGTQVSFTEGCVPGPVMSGCADRSGVYLSTGSDLLSLRLTEESSQNDGPELNEKGATNRTIRLQSPISLNVCGISALTKPVFSTTGEVELFCLSDKGQLRRITLPKARVDGESSTRQKAQTGLSVKDLLSAIGDVCERASHLKTSIKSKNHILRCLNQVMNVSFLLLNTPNGAEQPIRCHAATKWTRLLQKHSLHITCVMENNSPYLLEQGWILNITVCPLSDISQEQSASTNYSFPLCSLNPGQKSEVTLPLTAVDDALFPITISCVLVFPLGTLFDEKQLASLLKAQNSMIILPLNSLTVDWLHALQLSTSASDKTVATCARTKTSDALRGFLKSKGKERVDKGETKAYSAGVKISSDLLRDTLLSKSSDRERKESNLCVTLLEWLLSEPHREVAGHPLESRTHSAVLHGQGPNGSLINEALAVVEVQVESLSLAAVCGLHHAIIDRVQVFKCVIFYFNTISESHARLKTNKPRVNDCVYHLCLLLVKLSPRSKEKTGMVLN
uniref:FA core complex associated protein 100 n=1 Tax=Neogobius melanostomus TaxID=47308 RepID=A0A8C6TNX0_9GOBI